LGGRPFLTTGVTFPHTTGRGPHTLGLGSPFKHIFPPGQPQKLGGPIWVSFLGGPRFFRLGPLWLGPLPLSRVFFSPHWGPPKPLGGFPWGGGVTTPRLGVTRLGGGFGALWEGHSPPGGGAHPTTPLGKHFFSFGARVWGAPPLGGPVWGPPPIFFNPAVWGAPPPLVGV